MNVAEVAVPGDGREIGGVEVRQELENADDTLGEPAVVGLEEELGDRRHEVTQHREDQPDRSGDPRRPPPLRAGRRTGPCRGIGRRGLSHRRWLVGRLSGVKRAAVIGPACHAAAFPGRLARSAARTRRRATVSMVRSASLAHAAAFPGRLARSAARTRRRRLCRWFARQASLTPPPFRVASHARPPGRGAGDCVDGSLGKPRSRVLDDRAFRPAAVQEAGQPLAGRAHREGLEVQIVAEVVLAVLDERRGRTVEGEALTSTGCPSAVIEDSTSKPANSSNRCNSCLVYSRLCGRRARSPSTGRTCWPRAAAAARSRSGRRSVW